MISRRNLLATAGAAALLQPEPLAAAYMRGGRGPNIQSGFIFDTDMAGDCDDVGAQAILSSLARKGLLQIDSVICDVNGATSYNSVCADILLHWAGLVAPVYSRKTGTVIGSNYTGQIQVTFGPAYGLQTATNNSYPDSSVGYRTQLAAAVSQGRKLTIVCVGSLKCLSDLLNSPADGISSLTGLQLINQGVRQLYQMGGDTVNITEYNFALDPAATADVINNWPQPIVLVGHTLPNFATTPNTTLGNTNPFQDAYTLHGGSNSWDPICALMAAGALDLTAKTITLPSGLFAPAGVTEVAPFFSLTQGALTINGSTGASAWAAGAGNQYYLGYASGATQAALTNLLNFYESYNDGPH